MLNTIVVLSGAGISAESGIATFRGSNGLWCNHNIYDVASPEGWARDYKLVLDFYNQRRKNVIEAQPNAAHYSLAELESAFNVKIITQNIDDLHERAGSKSVMHLHGEIRLARSTVNPFKKYPINGCSLNDGDCCEDGYQLRPDVVWFGEEVPLMSDAIEMVASAHCLIVVGTSLNVYPAANLLFAAPDSIKKYYIDPDATGKNNVANLIILADKAGKVLPDLVKKLIYEGIPT